MKHLITVFIIFTLSCFSYAQEELFQGDLVFGKDTSNDIINLTMEVVSIPFEGLNRELSVKPINRVFEIFNGSIHRRYHDSTQFRDSQIVYHKRLNLSTPFVLASSFSESSSIISPRWGFAKYLVTFENISDPSKSIKLYLNTLDSKLGIDTISGSGYHADFYCQYKFISVNQPIVVFGFNNYSQSDTVRLNEQYKEITMWNLFYNRTTPLEKNFKAKTTPFPIGSNSIIKYLIRELSIGTSVVLDTVLPNLGNLDRYGYNTENSGSVPYYSKGPELLQSFGGGQYAVLGNVYLTPGLGEDVNQNLTGFKLIADVGVFFA